MVLVTNEPAANRPREMAWIIFAVICATAFHISASLVQSAELIAPSGLNTQVTLSGSPPDGRVRYDITGGTRVGANLFHSFGDFNVPNNNIANFLNDTGSATSSILGRVTGGNPSNIFGTIQTTGFGNANLYLMNPAGIVFGPNASLNVGGSITFTTADYLRLDKVGGPKAGFFYSDPVQTSLLTSASVEAFGFLSSNPGTIYVHGSQLKVLEGQGISLVGGNIEIQNGALEDGFLRSAKLSAPNGHINLATARSPGEFLRSQPVGPIVPHSKESLFRSFGSVHLEPGSIVDVSQSGNGNVSIRDGHLVLEIHNAVLDSAGSSTPATIAPNQDTIVLAPRSSIISQTSSEDRGADIRIMADRIAITGDPGMRERIAEFTGIRSETQGAGNAGNIILEATGNVETNKVVNLLSITHASGDAGNVTLTSTHGNIRMIEGGQDAQVFSSTFAGGNAGNVTASAPEGDIVLNGVALYTLSEEGTGTAGQVEISAQNLWMNTGLLGNGSRNSPIKPNGITVTLSGNLMMTTDSSLVPLPGVLPNSLIFTASPGSSPAADINITAKGILVTQGSSIKSDAFASGPGGNLMIVTDTLQITEGGQLSSGSTRALTSGSLPQNIIPSGQGGDITIQATGSKGAIMIDGPGSGIFSNAEGIGAAGDISVKATLLTLQNGGKISAETTGTSSTATGGSITINATDQVTLKNGASITASSTGPADAGSIFINAGQQLEVLDDSSITTQATRASGGNIDIRAIDRIRFVNSTVSTSVLAEDGKGGNIFIDPNVVILEGSEVAAKAVGGAGGNITFVTPLFLADSVSLGLLSAKSESGLNGTVLIQSPTSNLSGAVGQLVSKTSPPQVLLQNRCVALAGGEQSTFLLAGRDALPSEPGGWLSSPVAMEHWTGEVPEEHVSRLMVRSRGWNTQPPLVMAKDKSTVLSLRRLTPPGFLVRSFATAPTGCSS